MISIFTPTYNRKNLLKRLYQSLLEQTDKNFEWIIVDDGSTDNTETLIAEWITENKIKIKYQYQQNAGKHVAFNRGIDLASGKLYFCVDSDDLLPHNATEVIRKTYENPLFNKSIGIVALKSDTSGKLLSDNLPNTTSLSTIYDLTSKYKSFGERSIIYRTDILKENRFPVIEGEKFMGECVLYDHLDKFGQMLLLDKIVTICEYQEGGLSNNFFKIIIKNPIGFKIYHKQRIDLAYSLKDRFGYAVRYNAFKFMSNDSQYNYKGVHHLIVALTIPLGFLLKLYYFKK